MTERGLALPAWPAWCRWSTVSARPTRVLWAAARAAVQLLAAALPVLADESDAHTIHDHLIAAYISTRAMNANVMEGRRSSGCCGAFVTADLW